MTNRYERIEGHGDLGLGTDEPDIRRFTRLTDKKAYCLRADKPGQEEGPGSVAADSEAGRSHPQPN